MLAKYSAVVAALCCIGAARVAAGSAVAPKPGTLCDAIGRCSAMLKGHSMQKVWTEVCAELPAEYQPQCKDTELVWAASMELVVGDLLAQLGTLNGCGKAEEDTTFCPLAQNAVDMLDAHSLTGIWNKVCTQLPAVMHIEGPCEAAAVVMAPPLEKIGSAFIGQLLRIGSCPSDGGATASGGNDSRSLCKPLAQAADMLRAHSFQTLWSLVCQTFPFGEEAKAECESTKKQYGVMAEKLLLLLIEQCDEIFRCT